MKKPLILLLLIVFLLLGFNYLFGTDMQLTALEKTPPVKNINDLFQPTNNNIVGTIEKGKSVKIVGCSNLKDGQVYLVELENGQQGYVTGAKFNIASKPSRSAIKGGVICW